MKIDLSKLTIDDINNIRHDYGDEHANAVLKAYHQWIREQRLKDKKKYKRK